LPGALHAHRHTLRHTRHARHTRPRHLPGEWICVRSPRLAGFALALCLFLARVGLGAGLAFPGRLGHHQDDQHHDYAQNNAEKSPEVGREHIKKGAALDREETLQVPYLYIIVAGRLGGNGKYYILAAGRMKRQLLGSAGRVAVYFNHQWIV
jgi:hypothetical protein